MKSPVQCSISPEGFTEPMLAKSPRLILSGASILSGRTIAHRPTHAGGRTGAGDLCCGICSSVEIPREFSAFQLFVLITLCLCNFLPKADKDPP